MINYTYASLLASPSVEKDYTIKVYNGNILESTFTDEDLYSEEIERYNPLCTEEQLKIGACEASYIKFKVKNTVGTLKGRKLLVFVKPTGSQYTESLQLGEYYVDKDELAGDRQSREIIAYDRLYKILSTDMVEWYSEVGLPMQMIDFRNAFFNYFGVTQVETTLCNDNMVITETIIAEQLTGLEILNCILSGNGCLGCINNEGKFKYINFLDYDIINYNDDYSQGTLVYEDYVVHQIETLKFYSNKHTIVVGEDVETSDNIYIIEDNFLFYDKLEEDLTVYVTNIFNVIKLIPKYRPLKAESLGNPCVEVGDMITYKNTEGTTISTFVLLKIEKGLQGLRDNFETVGHQYYEYDLNSNTSKILRLWNNTLVLQQEMENARCYVYAQRNPLSINIGPSGETTLITIQFATVDKTIPIFIATIPLIMDNDGEIIFKYYLDGLEIDEGDKDIIYLTKGEQFVTLSTFFEMEANIRRTFTLTAQTRYKESVERQQTAKILSLKDWIDNQSITVEDDEGVLSASFDYDYVEQPVDTTPPGAFIKALKIRASIFASGLANSNNWDGTFTIVDETEEWITSDGLTFEIATDEVDVNPQAPIGDTTTDVVSNWTLSGGITFENEYDTMLIEMHAEVFRMITESEDILLTEDGDVFYTEGD